MGIGTAVLYGLMLIVIVFLVLGGLYLLILGFSFVIRKLEATALAKKPVAEMKEAPVAATATSAAPKAKPTGVWGGELLLKNVDEPTAAMIMAIVSDKSGIPLGELVFKSISLVEAES